MIERWLTLTSENEYFYRFIIPFQNNINKQILFFRSVNARRPNFRHGARTFGVFHCLLDTEFNALSPTHFTSNNNKYLLPLNCIDVVL